MFSSLYARLVLCQSPYNWACHGNQDWEGENLEGEEREDRNDLSVYLVRSFAIGGHNENAEEYCEETGMRSSFLNAVSRVFFLPFLPCTMGEYLFIISTQKPKVGVL